MGMDVWVSGLRELKTVEGDDWDPSYCIDTCDRENIVSIPAVVDGKYEVIIKVEDIPKDVKYIHCYYR